MGKLNGKLLLSILLLAFLLRVIKVGSFPPLYTDEASFGYNAFSLLKTGRDEYGIRLPVILRSFGDYKPALSSYLMIPFVSFLGLNELAIRLPSVILGTLTVLLIYLLTKEFFQSSISLMASFLLAISPCHIHLSRMSMLVGIELFFMTAGIYFFIKGAKEKAGYFFLSTFCFALSLYVYYGTRLILPLILISLFVVFRKRLLKKKKAVLLSGLLALLILLPLFLTLKKNPAILTARVKWVSLFRYPEVRGRIWDAIGFDAGMPPLFVRFLHNKPVYYLKDILRRYLQHFSPSFLLFQGDKASPFHIWGLGVSYLALYPFLLLGFVKLLQNRKREWWVILFWLLIAPLPASLTAYTPAANRSFNLVVPLQIITALGLVNFFGKVKKGLQLNKILLLFTFLFLLNFVYFLRQYGYITLRKIPREYRFGQKELVKSVGEKVDDYDQVIASEKATGYIFFLFYERYSPEKYWQEAEIDTTLNDFGFEHVLGFNKYRFKRNFDWIEEEKREKVLYVAYDEEIIEDDPVGYKLLKMIYYPNGEPGIKVIEL